MMVSPLMAEAVFLIATGWTHEQFVDTPEDVLIAMEIRMNTTARDNPGFEDLKDQWRSDNGNMPDDIPMAPIEEGIDGW